MVHLVGLARTVTGVVGCEMCLCRVVKWHTSHVTCHSHLLILSRLTPSNLVMDCFVRQGNRLPPTLSVWTMDLGLHHFVSALTRHHINFHTRGKIIHSSSLMCALEWPTISGYHLSFLTHGGGCVYIACACSMCFETCILCEECPKSWLKFSVFPLVWKDFVQQCLIKSIR